MNCIYWIFCPEIQPEEEIESSSVAVELFCSNQKKSSYKIL